MNGVVTRTFGALLRRYRTDRELTQEELAERAGLSVRAISDLERGVNRAPYQVTVESLIEALALSAGDAAALRGAGSRRRGPTSQRKSGDGVAHLVARFNRDGIDALVERHGSGQPKRYTEAEQERILREARRTPDRNKDGTATWSLTTLRRALRHVPDGLPGISTYTIWCVLHDAGFVWTKDQSWCKPGTVVRKRKSGTVTVVDPDATAKKS